MKRETGSNVAPRWRGKQEGATAAQAVAARRNGAPLGTHPSIIEPAPLKPISARMLKA